MPPPRESGVTSFVWQTTEPVSVGSHKLYSQCINPRGQVSGQSNILRFIILPPAYFASQNPGQIAAASAEHPAQDTNLLADEEINELMAKANTWSQRWGLLIGLVILIVIILVTLWIMSFKSENKDQKVEALPIVPDEISQPEAETDQFVETENNEPIISGPEINYDNFEAEDNFNPNPEDNEYVLNNEDEFNNDEHMPPPPPPIDSPSLGF